jgi:hypothetical protein
MEVNSAELSILAMSKNLDDSVSSEDYSLE